MLAVTHRQGQGTWRSAIGGRQSLLDSPDMVKSAALATATGSARDEYDPPGDPAIAKLVEGLVDLGQWLGGRLAMNFARGRES